MVEAKLTYKILPWQQQRWERLCQQVDNGSLPHAMLFSGMPGLGKQQLAQQLAQYILCQQRGKYQACAACKSCRLFAAGNHPDLQCIAPEGKANSIRVDVVRELADWVNQSAFAGGKKVVIISDAQQLNVAASNSLLKTLEEPNSDTIFILLSSAPNRLLPTIRSRCQQIKFAPVSAQQGLVWLRQHLGAKFDNSFLLHLSHYAPLQAVALANDKSLQARQAFLQACLDLLAHARSADPIALAGKWHKDDVVSLLAQLSSLLIDAVKYALGQDQARCYHQDFAAPCRALVERYNTAALLQMQQHVQQCYRDCQLAVSLNSQLLLENLFCTLYQQREYV